MNLWKYYDSDIPALISRLSNIPEMKRLQHVGMNCGCEYTSFPLFRSMKERYTRFDHSMGTAVLVWRFTQDSAQTLAAAFHDIATPCFAHVVDFMAGDHMRQESTESRTREMIEGSAGIQAVIEDCGLAMDQVADYHQYPIADNDSPKLSADRLEYTLGNLVNYGLKEPGQALLYLDDLTVATNEHGETELVFRNIGTAAEFANDALKLGKIYVSDEDRFAMEMLARLLKETVGAGVITMDDLWTTEKIVIEKLKKDQEYRNRWDHFCGYYQITRGTGIAIRAKKRYIDPLVDGRGRVSELCGEFAEKVNAFLAEPQDKLLNGVSHRFEAI